MGLTELHGPPGESSPVQHWDPAGVLAEKPTGRLSPGPLPDQEHCLDHRSDLLSSYFPTPVQDTSDQY